MSGAVLYSAQSDEALFDTWATGDRRAGMALVNRYYESISRFFIHRLGPDTEDLVQDTFVGLQRGLGRFRGESSVRIYLFQIARNQLLTALRGRARDVARFDPSESTLEAIDPSMTAILAASDEHKLLVSALRKLSVDTQIMLELHYWEGMKLRQIAEIMKMNVNTIKARMSRGRKALLEHMTSIAESKQQLDTTLHQLSDWIEDMQAVLNDPYAEPSDGPSHSI